MNEFKFNSTTSRQWTGRYRRPAGKESAYHVSIKGLIELHWSDGDYELACRGIETPAVKAMANAVNEAKRRHAGQPGGSFVINEFGQVISAIQNSRQRFLVGEATGILWFEDPRTDNQRL